LVRRIQEVLKNELGLSSRVAMKNPMLTEQMVKNPCFFKKVRHWKEGHVLRIVNLQAGHLEGGKGREAQLRLVMPAPLYRSNHKTFGPYL
jgi:hypothetical protein